MDEKPLVSVISIFYNLEGCTARCIKSLINQTYKNCEFILVDDGSTDGTFSILKEFDAIDNRITAIKTENGGPGKARNTGLDKASGRYVTYVDGDDFLLPWCVEYLVEAIQSGSEQVLAIGGSIIGRPTSAVENFNNFELCFHYANEIDMLQSFLYDEITESPWAKLFDYSFAKQHPFPESRWYEDVSWSGKMYTDAGSAVLVENAVYIYVMNEGSVTHKAKPDVKQVQDFEQAIEDMVSAMPTEGYEKCIAFRMSLENARMYDLAWRLPNSRYKDEVIASIKGAIKDDLATVLNDDRVLKTQKIRFLLLAYASFFYRNLYGVYRILKKNK